MKAVLRRFCFCFHLRAVLLPLFFFVCSGYTEVFAYTAQELRADCKSAEALFTAEFADERGRKLDFPASLAGARCLSYLQGFVGGYETGEMLARRVGVEYIAFCLPPGTDAPALLHAVQGYLAIHPLPPENLAAIPARHLVTAALARSFVCESVQKNTDN